MKSSYLSFLLLLTLISIISCKSDNAESVDLNAIIGHWVIAEAERDGSKTELLNNGFIIFNSDSLEHNLAGQTTTRHYSIDKNVITSNDPLLDKVIIHRMDADTAIFSTDFNKYSFKFILVKDEIK